MKDSLTSRTEPVLGQALIEKLRDTQFCILGCGAVGTLFAEMLVRSGAENLTLIDGDFVEITNLNRTFPFSKEDDGKSKVDVLANRLKKINPDVNVNGIKNHLSIGSDRYDKEWKAIANSSYVIIVMDNNDARRKAELICKDDKHCDFMSIGIYFEDDGYTFECVWKPETPKTSDYEEDYGLGSYISPVIQATAAGFEILLSHLAENGCKQQRILRKFPYFSATPACEEIK